MKIHFTAEYDPSEIGPLMELGEVVIDGWAKGLPKLTEAELLERTADADVIVTTFDDMAFPPSATIRCRFSAGTSAAPPIPIPVGMRWRRPSPRPSRAGWGR